MGGGTPGDAYGNLLLLVPLALTLLMLVALFGFRALGFAMLLSWVTVIVSAFLVGADAQRLGAGTRHPGIGPIAWGLLTLLLWFISYPIYCAYRARYGAKNLIAGGLLVTLFLCLITYWIGQVYTAFFGRF